MKKKPVKKPVKKKKLTESPEHQKKLELILALSMQTSALELAKDEYVEMAPFPGMCGPFRLSGNSLPVFEYLLFEQKTMEFIKVRVEIAKPDRIDFIATIDCKGAKGQHTDSARHGEVVPMKDKYKEPFEKLAGYLKVYFPYYRNGIFDRTPNRKDTPKQIENGAA